MTNYTEYSQAELNHLLHIDHHKMKTISTTNNEAEIDGKRIHYDAVNGNTLSDALHYYKYSGDQFTYIGSSHVTYHDGMRHTSEKLEHFFVRKTNSINNPKNGNE